MINKARKIRLDQLLVEKKLARSRTSAQHLIKEKKVTIDGRIMEKPAEMISPGANVAVVPQPQYVSRSGVKLAQALHEFNINVQDKICADVGSSTGGFTDCLLQNGAKLVYAIDVGFGVLDWRLRHDKRVVVMEKTNARYLASLPMPIDLAVIDVSFISLRLIWPVVKNWLGPGGQAVSLIKPQFEAGYKEVSKARGVIKDERIQEQIIETLKNFASDLGWRVHKTIPSPLPGRKGNQEYLIWLSI